MNTINAKTDYRSVFKAMDADIKTGGGYGDITSQLNVTEKTLRNQVDPNCDVSPPTLANFLEIINLTKGKRTVSALASLVDKALIDLDYSDCCDKSQVEVFLQLATKASKLLSTGLEAAEDNRFDAIEREQLLPLLLELIQVSGKLCKRLNS